jgi:chaperone BCS1
LSYLFYGKPGCGKTSLIKALANYLGYSIIEVKLSFMHDDSSLNDMFHNRALLYHRNNDVDFAVLSDIVPLEKRIYIFEDIDAECDEIHQRSEMTVEVKPETIKEKTEAFKEMLKKIDNNITLAGVLNALDGVLEISGIFGDDY